MKLEENETMVEEQKKPKEQKKLRFKLKNHWLGYLAIGCAAVLSLLVLTCNIVSAYDGFKMASLPSLSSDTAKAIAEANTESAMAAPVEGGEEKIVINTPLKTASAPKVPDTGGGDEKAEETWHFYNTDLQDDGIAANDYNFGLNPVTGTPEAVAKLTEVMERKGLKDKISMEELIGEIDPKDVDKDFRERMRKDPALGAADMAWSDSILGTRYLGKFYSEAKEQWDVAMNEAKEGFIADKDSYYKTLDAFEEYLDSADKVEIRKQTTGLNDQMYMNPHTVDKIPDIIVMESADHAGWFLVYHFTIKETAEKEIMFRLDCGYQPTNVAKVMKVKAQKNPTKKTKKVQNKTVVAPVVTTQPIQTPQGQVTVTNTFTSTVVPDRPKSDHHHKSDPDPTPDKPNPDPEPVKPDPDPVKPDPDPVKPDPEPTPTPPGPDPIPVPDDPKPEPTPTDPDPIPVPPDPTETPIKDPTKGTEVLPNDDTGPGEDTNNPADPEHSTKDLPTNSNHLTPDEYDKAMEDNRSANEDSRQGGDSNEPSTPAPTPDTNVDNNGDTGTGYGGIDVPTPTADSSVSDDPAGEAWDGPPDAGSSSSGKKKGGSDRPSPD